MVRVTYKSIFLYIAKSEIHTSIVLCSEESVTAVDELGVAYIGGEFLSLLGTILALSAGIPIFQRVLIKESIGLFSVETLQFLQAPCMSYAVPPVLSGVGYTSRYLSLLVDDAT